MFLRMLRLLGRAVLALIARVDLQGVENIPPQGHACVVVSNHIGRLDAMLVFILTERDDIIMFIAEKYQTSRLWRWFARRLDAIWLDREELDMAALRAAQRRLADGGMLAMAPEGTRSKSGVMIQAKAGAAWLAARAAVPIVPVGITGTEDRIVKQRLRSGRRLDVVLHIGPSFELPPLDRRDRDAYLERATDEIMCRIGASLPPSYHGFYAHHARLAELQRANSVMPANRSESVH